MAATTAYGLSYFYVAAVVLAATAMNAVAEASAALAAITAYGLSSYFAAAVALADMVTAVVVINADLIA